MIQTASDMAVFNKRNELCSIHNTLIIDTIWHCMLLYFLN